MERETTPSDSPADRELADAVRSVEATHEDSVPRGSDERDPGEHDGADDGAEDDTRVSGS